MDDVNEVVSEMRKEGLLVESDEEETPTPVTELQPPAIQQPAIAPAPLQPPRPPVETGDQDDNLVRNLEVISKRLQEIDEQMREQERRLDQILTDGQVSVGTVVKG